jgi:CrcB protein
MDELRHILLVAIGGAAGAAARYGVGRLVIKRAASAHYSTLFVNLTGAFVLGILYGLDWPDRSAAALLLAGTGFLGGFTTFSTLNTQLAAMASNRRYRTLIHYSAFTYPGGLALAYAGYMLGELLRT